MVKSFSIFFVGLLFVLGDINAQNIILGIKGGLDFAKISGKSFLASYSPSFEAGGYAGFKLNSKLTLQTELVYSQQIEKVNSDQLQNVVYIGGISNSAVNSDATIGSVSLPILIKFKVNSLFSIDAGPAFVLNAYTSENIFQSGRVAFKPIDLSVSGGATLNLSGFNIYARYNHGLTNINNYDNLDSWKSRQLSFGLEIPIKSFKKA